jgi:hypothetical protein
MICNVYNIHQIEDIVLPDVMDSLNRMLKLPLDRLINVEFLSLGTLYRDRTASISITPDTLNFYFWVDDFKYLQCFVNYTETLKEKVNELNDLFNNKPERAN